VTLAGTGKLIRFLLRASRVRIVLWIAGIALLVWSTAISIDRLYPTQADLDAAAAPLYDNTAVIAMLGPTYAIDTLGGQIVFQLGAFGFATMGLMGMFLVGRHTRADEEEGRTELLRATVVGRNAPVTAALLVATGAVAVTGVLITLIMLSLALSVEGSAIYGAAMAAFGIFFACVTAVLAQVTENNRTAYGMTGALLGLSYLLRAVGDAGSGTLSWLSPMGWAQQVRAYADERWWPLLLLVAGSAVLVAGAFALLSRRDLGGGLVPPRPGPPEAAPWLGRPWGLTVRLQRVSLVSWTLGLLAFGVAYGALGKDIADFVGDNQTVEDLIAQGAGSLTDTYFATSLLTMALIAAGFAIASILRLRSEETGGSAEQLLATALSRPQWAASHLAMAAGGSVVIMAATGLGLALAYGVSIRDLSDLPELMVAAVAFAPALWVLVALGLALFGVAPRAVLVTWGALAVCFVIGLFADLLDLPSWVVDISPFQHVPAMPAEDFALGPLLALTAVAAGLTVVGLVGFRRRDAGY
jgi:ABC-2 type transport system permease protein